MDKIVLFLFTLMVGANALSRRVIHPRWSLIKPESINVDHFEDTVDSIEIEPRQFCTCGVKKKNKIIGGNYATENEYPWMAAVCAGDFCMAYSFICGGSLINDQYVLTAAHCVQGLRKEVILVSLGGNKLSTDPYSNAADSVAYNTEKIIQHKDYEAETLKNDIALIKLTTKVEMTDKISPICLPPQETSYVGKSVYLTGWGDTTGGNRISVTLKELEMKVILRKECAAAFSELPDAIYKKMLCAKGGEQTNGCRGDSGGPLVYSNSNGYYEQIGIVSGARNCTNFQQPAIFTSVKRYLKFIKTNTKDATSCTDNSPD